jgi:HEAT repeat protein
MAAMLTPVTICFDAAIIAAVVLALAKGGGNGLSLPSLSGSGSHRHSPCRIQMGIHALHLALSARRARRLSAVKNLRGYGFEAKSAVPALRRLLHDEDPEVRLEAAMRLRVLCPYDPGFYMPTVVGLLSGPDVEMRRATATALGTGKVYASVPALIHALQDGDEEVRCNAAVALGRMGDKAGAAVPAFRMTLNDFSPAVREAAHKALGSIHGGGQ